MSNGKHVSNFAKHDYYTCEEKKPKDFTKGYHLNFKKNWNNIECKKSFTHIYIISSDILF